MGLWGWEQTTLELLAILGELLRTFKAADIKRFGSFYTKLMKSNLGPGLQYCKEGKMQYCWLQHVLTDRD